MIANHFEYLRFRKNTVNGLETGKFNDKVLEVKGCSHIYVYIAHGY